MSRNSSSNLPMNSNSDSNSSSFSPLMPSNDEKDALLLNQLLGMDSASPNSSTLSNPLCDQIEQTLRRPAYLAILHVNLALLAISLAALAFLLHKYLKEPIIVHGNLLLLFANIILLYAIHNFANFFCLLRYRVLLSIYSDPCELLTPFWLVALCYGPSCVYMLAYPAFHFCVMIERIRATLLAEKYENEGQKLGIWMVATIWFLSLGFTGFVIGTDLADPAVSAHSQGVIYLTSKDNQLPIFYASILTLLLVILTAICDWRITLINRRICAISRNFKGYSLSRNFQLKENILAMRLILPLDISYALFYSLYNSLEILIRAFSAQQSLSIPDYYFYYDMANMLLFGHSAVTILVYIRFIRFVRSSQKRNVESRPKTEHGRIYFNQLASQWA